MLQYTIIITHTNGSQTTIYTPADNASHAHIIGLYYCKKGDTLRVYATTATADGEILIDGVQAGSLTVVKRTTANMVSREGGDLQYRLYNECRRSEITDPDVLDCLSVAQLAIIEAIANGENIADQYHKAYLALNKYLRDNRQINLSVTAQRTVYIEDVDGEIVSVNGKINRILSPSERYSPISDEIDDPTHTDSYNAIIKEITSTLTPTQIRVLKYLAKGYSQRQIASVTKRSVSTINEHIKLIRKKAIALYPDGYKPIK